MRFWYSLHFSAAKAKGRLPYLHTQSMNEVEDSDQNVDVQPSWKCQLMHIEISTGISCAGSYIHFHIRLNSAILFQY